jgi:DNA primase
MPPVPAPELRRLRNQVDIVAAIRDLDVPHRHRDGELRFLCPRCGEFRTAVNPATNLGRCFRCEENFNPIDLVMAVDRVSFLDAVRYLQRRFPADPPLPRDHHKA